MVFRKLIFVLGHLIFKPKVLPYYFIFKKNENKNLNQINAIKKRKIDDYILKMQSRVSFFKGKQINYKNAPITTKSDIKKNQRASFEFSGAYKVKPGQTGGSTGEPLKYLMTDDYSARGLALLYRGWSRGGYKLGDKVAVIAGGSLIKNNTTFKAKVINYILNMDKYSSFGMTEKDMLDYITYVTNSKAKFVRGYVTSIYEIANLILKYDLSIQVKAVFTTAEMLTKHQRQVIEKAFNCSVFNTYGLNDGGVSAYECNEHNGFHIDVERSFLDVVDASGKPIVNEVGKIIATSYTNFGTCFFKYDTGDLGVLSSEQCKCGSPYPLLKNIQGRITESITYNSKTVGSPVLTVLMSSFDVNMYQFIQVDESKLILVIDKGATFNVSDEKAIRDSIKSNLGEVVLEIVSDKARFEKLANGKHILVLNKMKKNEI